MSILWILVHCLPVICFVIAVIVVVQTVIFVRHAFFGPTPQR
jgi:uncharacterized membrane protein